jgi:modulator of FtsH protease HflC
MRYVLGFLLAVLALAAVGLYSSAFIVHQNQQAIVLRFGDPTARGAPITKPGLHWKIPFVETVEFFNTRILDIDTDPQTVIVADKKQLVVDSFARYRIVDPLKYFQKLGNEQGARSRLGVVLDSSLRLVLGSATIEAVVRDKRGELMDEIQRRVNADAKEFGIEITDVRIMRADLPPAISESIYKRMQTERGQEASQFRGEGEEQSRRIKADADRQVTIIKAEATRDSEKVRGEGDAERNRIFAEAFTKNESFFEFYRTMQAYERGLKGDTRMVLSPSSDFFRYFNNPDGNSSSPGAKPGASVAPEPLGPPKP